MTQAELEQVLAKADQALADGDVLTCRGHLDTFDAGIEALDLAETPLAARAWLLRLAGDRSDHQPEELLARGSRLARKARRNSWHTVQGKILCIMGRSALDLLDFRRAQVWFEEAFAAGERSNDNSLRAKAIVGSAMVWELQGESQPFCREAERALPYAERGDELLVLAEVLTTLGRAQLRLGEPEGEHNLTAAEALLADAKAHVALLKNLLDRLVLPMTARDFDAAEAILVRAEELSQVVHDKQVLGRVALDRGELLRLRGDTAGAIARYQKTLDLVTDKHPVGRVALLNLALTQIIDGQADNVKATLPRLLQITQDHATFHGLAHLMALAIGPLTKKSTKTISGSHTAPPLASLSATPAEIPMSTPSRKQQPGGC